MRQDKKALIGIPFFIGLAALLISLAISLASLITFNLKLKGLNFNGAPYKRSLLAPEEIKPQESLAAVLVEKSANPTLSPQGVREVVVKLQNTGQETWERNGSTPVQLGILPPQKRFSNFHSKEWISVDRPAKLIERSVKPDEVGTFIFNFQGVSKLQPGVYPESMRLVKEKVNWFGPTIDWQIFLRPAKLVSVSALFPQFFNEFAYRFDPKPVFAFNILIVAIIFFAFSASNVYLYKVFPRTAPTWKMNIGPFGRLFQNEDLPAYIFHWRFYTVIGGTSLLFLAILFLVLSTFIYQESSDIKNIEITLSFAFYFLIGATFLTILSWQGYATKEGNYIEKSTGKHIK